MTVTETEAAKKRCHRDMRDWCIGSLCMAWRWAEPDQIEFRKKGEPAPEGDGWKPDNPNVQLVTYRRTLKHGYCGLAGIPWAKP